MRRGGGGGEANYSDNLREFIADSAVSTAFDFKPLVHYDEISINAATNNDSGNSIYVYKIIVDIDIPAGSAVGIRCTGIDNNKQPNSIWMYAYDADGNSKIFSKTGITDFSLIYIPAEYVRVDVRLYPSISGGLTDSYTVYTGVDVWLCTNVNEALHVKSRLTTSQNPPSYYFADNYLQGKIDTIRGYMAAAGGNYDAFVFCTDAHWYWNARRSPALLKYISERVNIPRLFFGGDDADGVSIDMIRSFDEAYKGKVYHTIGNHEQMDFLEENGTINITEITDGHLWAYLNGHLTDAVLGSSARNYYYVDNFVQKMRYVVLNVFADNGSLTGKEQFEEAQESWFRNVALDLPEGYTCVIFAHSVAYLDEAYNVTYGKGTHKIYEIVDAYNGNGVIAGIFQGHNHMDHINFTSSGVPIINTTCDKYKAYPGSDDWLASQRTFGTITEQAFDVVIVDKSQRKIFAVRIGCPAYNADGTTSEVREIKY